MVSLSDRTQQILRRLRRSSLRELIRMFLTVRAIDFILFEADLDSIHGAGELKEDVTVVRSSPENPSGTEAIDRKLSRGRHCYSVFIDGHLAHESWLFLDSILPMQFGFDPRVPVIGECATPELFRGRRLYPKTLRFAVRDVISRGVSDRVYLWVAPENTPSIRGVERAGFRRLARLRGWKYGGMVFSKRVEA